MVICPRLFRLIKDVVQLSSDHLGWNYISNHHELNKLYFWQKCCQIAFDQLWYRVQYLCWWRGGGWLNSSVIRLMVMCLFVFIYHGTIISDNSYWNDNVIAISHHPDCLFQIFRWHTGHARTPTQNLNVEHELWLGERNCNGSFSWSVEVKSSTSTSS